MGSAWERKGRLLHGKACCAIEEHAVICHEALNWLYDVKYTSPWSCTMNLHLCPTTHTDRTQPPLTYIFRRSRPPIVAHTLDMNSTAANEREHLADGILQRRERRERGYPYILWFDSRSRVAYDCPAAFHLQGRRLGHHLYRMLVESRQLDRGVRLEPAVAVRLVRPGLQRSQEVFRVLAPLFGESQDF